MSYNFEKVKESVKMFLEGIGHPAEDPNIKDTPDRVAKMYGILLGGYDEGQEKHIVSFPTISKAPIHVVNTQFYSFCAHHLLKFEGKIHVGYVPNGKVLGLSKLVRIPRIESKKLNLQEDLTFRIADKIQEATGSEDVIVRIESSHSCMTMRGVRSPEAITITTEPRGIYFTNNNLLNMFLGDIKAKDVRSY